MEMAAHPLFPQAAAFPKRGPKAIPEWVWGRFLNAVHYREALLHRAEGAEKHTPYSAYLYHEIKRTEIDIGLWIGRMQEMEIENG